MKVDLQIAKYSYVSSTSKADTVSLCYDFATVRLRYRYSFALERPGLLGCHMFEAVNECVECPIHEFSSTRSSERTSAYITTTLSFCRKK